MARFKYQTSGDNFDFLKHLKALKFTFDPNRNSQQFEIVHRVLEMNRHSLVKLHVSEDPTVLMIVNQIGLDKFTALKHVKIKNIRINTGEEVELFNAFSKELKKLKSSTQITIDQVNIGNHRVKAFFKVLANLTLKRLTIRLTENLAPS